ncbi:MAG: ammonium transporter, partial [Acidimicrobiales bacterium]
MPGRIVVGAALVLAFGLGRAAPVAAQEVDPAAHTQFVLDNIWVFVAGVLVFLMQAGFAMVEAGLTRAKSVANIMAKNLADMMIGVVAFFAIGFTLAYSGDGWLAGDLDDLFLSSTADPAAIFGTGEGLTPATNFFFQVVFAATAVTIASGAMAERT